MLSKIEELCIKVQFLWVENSFVSLCKRLVRLLRPKAANYANVISSKIIRILEQVLVSTRLGIERQLTLWCEFGLTFPPLSDIALQISSESCWQAICKSRFLPPIFLLIILVRFAFWEKARTSCSYDFEDKVCHRFSCFVLFSWFFVQDLRSLIPPLEGQMQRASVWAFSCFNLYKSGPKRVEDQENQLCTVCCMWVENKSDRLFGLTCSRSSSEQTPGKSCVVGRR